MRYLKIFIALILITLCLRSDAVSVVSKSRNFTNGTANDATAVDASFVDVYGNDQTLATYINNMQTTGHILANDLTISLDGSGNIAYTLNASHTGAPTQTIYFLFNRGTSSSPILRWSETDGLFEASTNSYSYYPISAVVSSTPSSAIEGWTWYNTTTHTLNYQSNTGVKTLGTNTYPPLYHGSAVPIWVSNSSFTVAYLHELDSSGLYNIDTASSCTVSTASTGLNGLDIGTVQANTWYYLYAVTNGSTTGFLASTVNEQNSGTISSANYSWTLQRQLPFAFRTDGSGNIYNFIVSSGWPARPTILYNLNTNPSVNGTTGTSQVLNKQESTSYQTLSLASWVPTISELALLNTFTQFDTSSTTYAVLRQNSLATDGTYIINGTGTAGTSLVNVPIPTDSSQVIQWKTSGSGDPSSYGLSLSVAGFVVTQVP